MPTLKFYYIQVSIAGMVEKKGGGGGRFKNRRNKPRYIPQYRISWNKMKATQPFLRNLTAVRLTKTRIYNKFFSTYVSFCLGNLKPALSSSLLN